MRAAPAAQLVLVALGLLALPGCALLSGRFGDLPTPAHVDLPRFMGHWRVIANIPYFAEKGCHDSIESYALRTDGDIDNWFSCRRDSPTAPLERIATAKAEVVNRSTNAEWNVKFLGWLKIKYVVLAVDPDYQWVAVAHPSRQYGWVMARSTVMDDATYQRVLKVFGDNGYDTSRFARVPQSTVPVEAPPL